MKETSPTERDIRFNGEKDFSKEPGKSYTASYNFKTFTSKIRIEENKKSRSKHTEYAGLLAVAGAWEALELDQHIREAGIVKKRGHPAESLTFASVVRPLIEAKSTLAMSEKLKNDDFLTKLRFGSPPDQRTHNRFIQSLNLDQINSLNNLVVRELQNFKKWRAKKDGFLLVDLTAIHVHGKNYENVKKLYDASLEKVVTGYEPMVLSYTDGHKFYPVAFLTQEKKTDSLPSLIKKSWNFLGTKVNKIVFDGGFYSIPLFNELDDMGIIFVTKPRKNSQVFYGIHMLTFEKLSTEWIKKVKYSRKYGWRYAEWKAYLPRFGEIKIVKLLDKNQEVLLITNDEDMPAEEVIKAYKMRWQTETMFRECKQNLGLNNLPTGKFSGIIAHIFFVLLGYILISLFKRVEKDFNGRSISTIIRMLIRVTADIIRSGREIVVSIVCGFKYYYLLFTERLRSLLEK